MSIKVVDNEATCLRLKEMFDERGLTPKEVQRALQLDSVQAVYKWLSPKNKTMPSLDSLVQLANLMDCQLEDILVLREIIL
ncbi:MAG: helix-turn-helix transcriptional regulator [Lachnospiraceae bacterium]|nr:helix-turn-helix transcriptional regulator [Lachnospiraceae bacterium]